MSFTFIFCNTKIYFPGTSSKKSLQGYYYVYQFINKLEYRREEFSIICEMHPSDHNTSPSSKDKISQIFSQHSTPFSWFFLLGLVETVTLPFPTRLCIFHLITNASLLFNFSSTFKSILVLTRTFLKFIFQNENFTDFRERPSAR